MGAAATPVVDITCGNSEFKWRVQSVGVARRRHRSLKKKCDRSFELAVSKSPANFCSDSKLKCRAKGVGVARRRHRLVN